MSNRYYVATWYKLSTTGNSKSTKYDVRDKMTEADDVVKTFSDKKKAVELADQMNRQHAVAIEKHAAEKANPKPTKEPKPAREKKPKVDRVETAGTIARREALALGFTKYAVRRYRYYLHLINVEGQDESVARINALHATRYVLWPFRMTREELKESK